LLSLFLSSPFSLFHPSLVESRRAFLFRAFFVPFFPPKNIRDLLSSSTWHSCGLRHYLLARVLSRAKRKSYTTPLFPTMSFAIFNGSRHKPQAGDGFFPFFYFLVPWWIKEHPIQTSHTPFFQRARLPPHPNLQDSDAKADSHLFFGVKIPPPLADGSLVPQNNGTCSPRPVRPFPTFLLDQGSFFRDPPPYSVEDAVAQKEGKLFLSGCGNDSLPFYGSTAEDGLPFVLSENPDPPPFPPTRGNVPFTWPLAEWVFPLYYSWKPSFRKPPLWFPFFYFQG